MQRFILLGMLAAAAACGTPAPVGVATGKGAPEPTASAVPVAMPSAAADGSLTAAQVRAAAERTFPFVQPFGYYGVCGDDENVTACPYTPRLKARLTQSRATLSRAQNPSGTLVPPRGIGGGGSQAGPAPYYGPATMTWSGQLPVVPSSAPVYRLTPPSEADVEALQARLGGSGYSFNATRDDPSAQLPLFYLNPPRQVGGTPGDVAMARAAANAELSRLGLTPAWPYTVSTSPPFVTFHYQRVVDLGGGIQAGLVDGGGNPLGIDVTVDSEGVAGIQGLVPDQQEESGRYALVPPNPQQALAAPPQVQETGIPPAVALTEVRLAYAVVRRGDDAYLEPAYLFTGTFRQDGHEAEKRVLVPALVASALGS